MKLESLYIATQSDFSNGLVLACGHFRIACITNSERLSLSLTKLCWQSIGNISFLLRSFFLLMLPFNIHVMELGESLGLKNLTSIQIYHEFVCVHFSCCVVMKIALCHCGSHCGAFCLNSSTSKVLFVNYFSPLLHPQFSLFIFHKMRRCLVTEGVRAFFYINVHLFRNNLPKYTSSCWWKNIFRASFFFVENKQKFWIPKLM